MGNKFSGSEIRGLHKTLSDTQPNLNDYVIPQKKQRAKGFLSSVTAITERTDGNQLALFSFCEYPSQCLPSFSLAALPLPLYSVCLPLITIWAPQLLRLGGPTYWPPLLLPHKPRGGSTCSTWKAELLPPSCLVESPENCCFQMSMPGPTPSNYINISGGGAWGRIFFGSSHNRDHCPGGVN